MSPTTSVDRCSPIMLYAITHRTSYSYSSDVSVSHHLAHLRPRELPWQQVADFCIDIEPESVEKFEHIDFYGNTVTSFSIAVPQRTLSVTASSRVRVFQRRLPIAALTPPWEQVRRRCSFDRFSQDSAAGELRFDSPLINRSPAFRDYASVSFPRDRPLLEGINDLTARIHHDFIFDSRATTVTTPLDEVFRERRGVCQDFAHLAIAAIRSLGLPARYVSGYLETKPLPGKPRLVGADASHAWFSVWCPDFGWIDADPTNNLLPGERYVTIAWGRDFSDVAPLHGVVMGGGDHGLRVSVDVLPLIDSAQISMPSSCS